MMVNDDSFPVPLFPASLHHPLLLMKLFPYSNYSVASIPLFNYLPFSGLFSEFASCCLNFHRVSSILVSLSLFVLLVPCSLYSSVPQISLSPICFPVVSHLSPNLCLCWEGPGMEDFGFVSLLASHLSLGLLGTDDSNLMSKGKFEEGERMRKARKHKKPLQ